MQLLTRFYIKLIFATLTMLISNVAYPHSDFVWRKLMATEKLPTDEIRCSHQDKMGFVWFGTNNGLFRYDGFHVKAYRNTEQNPFLLSSKTSNADVAVTSFPQFQAGVCPGKTSATTLSQ